MSKTLINFDWQPRTRVVFGDGALSRLGELAGSIAVRRTLLVTDAGVVAAGHVERAMVSLHDAGVTVILYDKVRENPTTGDVDACLAVARESAIDSFVALGGGSSMDTAKGTNFLLTNGGRMQDYRGEGKATRPMLPLIAMPTTAGTGSECQSAALIADEETHQKMACRDPKAAPVIALLDPRLTVTQPPRVTACTGVDAVAHALETAVTTVRHQISLMYSHRSFALTHRALPRVMEHPNDVSARADMLLGAALAGCAIEQSMLGAAHAAANPLTAHFGVPHGQAVGMMLPGVVAFNSHDPAARCAYADLAVSAGLASPGASGEQCVDLLLESLRHILDHARMSASLVDCGVPASAIPALAAEAASQWTATFNPRRLTSGDFDVLYRLAMEPRQAARHAHDAKSVTRTGAK